MDKPHPINAIKSRLNLVDLIEETVPLKRSGKNLTGFCPFHPNTQTPAFVVFPESQTWHCFGACADGGDGFGFVMRRDGLDFKAALELLARRTGVELPRYPPGPATGYARLFEVNAAAAAWYAAQLERSQTARLYLTGRGLTAETITLFQLGYAPEGWRSLAPGLARSGFTPEELLQAGLLVENGGHRYDRFRKRLVIPIRDERGQVVGFGARTLGEELPKYLNTPQTPLFNKSASLFGLDLARPHLVKADRGVVVEGYFDVIQAHQHGAGNVVAPMGTAFTAQHLNKLRGFTKNITLALDADAAGQAALGRSVDTTRRVARQETAVVTPAGYLKYESRLAVDLSIAVLPPGQDPDSLLRHGGPAAWLAVVAQAQPVADFVIDGAVARYNLTTARGKRDAANEVVPLLREIAEPVARDHYEQKLARLLGVDAGVVRAAVNRPPPAQRAAPRPSSPKPTPAATLEDYACALALTHPLVIPYADGELEQLGLPLTSPRDFTAAANRELYRLISRWAAFIEPTEAALTDLVGPELAAPLAVARQLPPPFAAPPALARELAQTLLRLREARLSEAIRAATDDDAVNVTVQLRTRVQQGRAKLAGATRWTRPA